MSDYGDGGYFFSAMESFPEHVHTIGMINIEIANLEIELSHLLSRLLGISEKLANILYFTPRANMARIEVVSKIAKHALKKEKTKLADIEKVIAKSKSVMGRRHDAMHGAWSISDEGVFRANLPMISPDVAKPIPIQELKDLLRDTRTIISKLMEINKAVHT